MVESRRLLRDCVALLGLMYTAVHPHNRAIIVVWWWLWYDLESIGWTLISRVSLTSVNLNKGLDGIPIVFQLRFSLTEITSYLILSLNCFDNDASSCFYILQFLHLFQLPIFNWIFTIKLRVWAFGIWVLLCTTLDNSVTHVWPAILLWLFIIIHSTILTITVRVFSHLTILKKIDCLSVTNFWIYFTIFNYSVLEWFFTL